MATTSGLLAGAEGSRPPSLAVPPPGCHREADRRAGEEGSVAVTSRWTKRRSRSSLPVSSQGFRSAIVHFDDCGCSRSDCRTRLSVLERPAPGSPVQADGDGQPGAPAGGDRLREMRMRRPHGLAHRRCASLSGRSGDSSEAFVGGSIFSASRSRWFQSPSSAGLASGLDRNYRPNPKKPDPELGTSGRGGTGRRVGLRSRWPLAVEVRVLSPAYATSHRYAECGLVGSGSGSGAGLPWRFW